ncbi:MAG: DUF4157 domain-containing protein [Acidimicrobiales bacterium]
MLELDVDRLAEIFEATARDRAVVGERLAGMAYKGDSRRRSGDQPDRSTRLSSAVRAPSTHGAKLARSIDDPSSSLAAARYLQRTLGNRATGQLIQRREAEGQLSVGAAGGTLDDATEAAVQRARRGGRPLNAATSERMQQALGADFSAVRVHSDAESERLNRSLNSEAFTTGSDVFIRPSSYRPGSPSGQRVLTHELVHVVQQGGAPPNRIQTKLTVGPARGPLEAEADQVARSLCGRAVPPPPSPALMRKLSPGAGRGLVQRYGKSTKNYTTTNTDINVPHMFTSQSIDPEVTATNQIRHTTEHEVNPRLYFSDDDSIAINKAKMREAKEFYATDAVIDTANNSLAAKGSAVVLVRNNNVTVNTPAHGQALKMVKPTITPNNGAMPTVGDLAHFGTSVCIDVAQKVMGTLGGGRGTQAVFRPLGSTTEGTEDFTPDDTGSSQVYKAADFIAGNTGGDTPTVGQLQHAMNQGPVIGQSGKAYGKKVDSKTRIARARALAVNEFARPRVGEGFATFSTRPRQGKKTWGYHYAGVVARSGDGNDWVTLENYNRTGDIKDLSMKLFKRLLKQNQALVDAKIVQLDTALSALSQDARDLDPRMLHLSDLREKLTRDTVARKLKELMVVMAENAGHLRAQGEADFAAAVNTEPKTKWFFHMYGSKKKQSFHEQAVKSDYFSNPLTVRVRKP